MSTRNQLLHCLENTQLSSSSIARKRDAIRQEVLAHSERINVENFDLIHAEDLARLFNAYDAVFFDQSLRDGLGKADLQFRISPRMTRSGGKTACFRRRGIRRKLEFEITVSSVLLFESFQRDDRPIVVTGRECCDRLDALQRIFEHELMHLAEFLVWDCSSCSRQRFQSMAFRFFEHTDHRHQLVTYREIAQKQHGIRIGGQVQFQFKERTYVGVVNRITKRATVLVKDPAGQRYSDGEHYQKYYIPLEKLIALD